MSIVSGGSEIEELARTRETDPRQGLTVEGAAERLSLTGPNELPPPPRERVLARVARNVREPMSLLLMVAAGVAGIGLREVVDATVILAIVALNAIIGTVQEGRAARALDALRALGSPTARVRRSGRTMIVPARELVDGDIVEITGGDGVPADIRLLETTMFEVDESVLTGESLPVEKDATAPARADAPVAEQPWAAFSGTHATRGTALAIVVATGSRTRIGAIAETLRGKEPPTPLQRELAGLSTRLGSIAVTVALLVFGLVLIRTGDLQTAFLGAVALAVAAVPEGLATVVTIALALGVRTMASHGAIVRRLVAVETLGSTDVICTDKTGTLTQNRMAVEMISLADGWSGAPSALEGPAAELVARVAVLCNDATLDPPTGDPLEVALLSAIGTEATNALRHAFPRIAAAPFDASRRMMTTIHNNDTNAFAAIKGAPETLIARCSDASTADGRRVTLSPQDRERLLATADQQAARGARTIALAIRSLEAVPTTVEDAEHDLTFVALAGLRDQIRPQAARAVADARAAGITVVMVTGDHPGTARAVAREVGIATADAVVHTGRDGLPDDPLSVSVYARVDPEQKLALVDALRAADHTVAVTGDGVNDAPALRHADIGVAMGQTGNDVARAAADLIVTDDDLATIVHAVREGRAIYDNIRKVVDYLVAGNLSEILVVVIALAAFPDLGIPLLPLQLLWVNLLTDGLPALALGVDPADARLMSHPPRGRRATILPLNRIAFLSGRAALIAAASLGSLAIARFAWNEPWAHARATMFTVLVVAHLLYAFAARWPAQLGQTPGRVRLRDLRPLLAATAAGGLLQIAVLTWPPAHDVFGTAQLTNREWFLVLTAGATPLAIMWSIRRMSSVPRAGG